LSGTGTVLGMSNCTNYTAGDQVTFKLTDSSATARLIQPGQTISGGTEANAPHIKVTAGTGNFDIGSTQRVKDLDFTGSSVNFGGASPQSNVIYGNLILSPGMSVASSGFGLTFAATSGTKTITTNGKTIDRPVTFSGVGGTFQLSDNMTVGSSQTTTLSNGTLDLNGKVLSTGLFNSSAVTARTLKSNLPNGKIVTTETAANTVFNVGTQTNLTVDRTNNWTIEIGGNTANTRTFAGGNLQLLPSVVFTNTTSGGALHFTGSSTFKSLDVTTPPQSLRFTAGTTTTIEDIDGLPSGTAGNLVTINSITGAAHTLAKSGAGTVCEEYLNVLFSTATPANKFIAKSSTNGGSNTGWYFGSTCTPSSKGRQFLPFFK
jgi:hypothetical protein